MMCAFHIITVPPAGEQGALQLKCMQYSSAPASRSHWLLSKLVEHKINPQAPLC